MSIDAASLRVTISADSAPAEKGIKSFSNKLNSAAKGFAVTGGILTGAITLPLIGIATNALSMAADFEQSMNVLQQVTGASTDTMAAMNAQALALGASTVFSAGEAAQAMLELGKAGMSTAEITASIPGVMSLAAAGGMDLANAANLTANALNAFHLDASEATRVADLLAAGANASSASMTDLGQGLQAAGFAFSNANQPIENLVASLAILTDVGLTGSDAGTALKNAFMRMMNPTAEAADLIKQLGISFYDASGTMKALPDIIDMLNGALAGMTDEQRDATLSTLFMSDGMKAMIPLLDQGSTGFNKMVAEVTKVGAASDVAGARMKGLSGGLEYLSGSVDSFLIGAAQPFLGTLNNIVLSVADAITAFGGLPPTVIMASLAFLGIAAAIGPVLLVLGGLAAALASPLLPIALLVVGVVALAAAWATNLGGIQEVTAAAFAPVQGWFTTTLAGAKALGTGISAAFANTKFPSLDVLWKQFQAGDFQTIANTIRSTAYTLMVNLDAELNITGKANELKAQLVGAVNSLGTAISNLDFSGATANASKMRDGILSGISGAIDSVDWAGGGATFAGMIAGLTSAVSSLDFSGIDWAATLQAVFVAPAAAAVAAINWVIGSDSFAGLQTSVKGAIQEIPWSDMTVETGGLLSAVGAQISAVFADMGGDLGLAMPTFTMPTIDWGQLTIDTVGLVTSVTNSINSTDWMSVGASVGTAIVNAVTIGISGIGAAIVGLNWANDAITSFKLQVVTFGTSIGTQIGTALQGIDLMEASTNLTASIQAALLKVFVGAVGGISASFGGFAIDLPTLSWSDYVKSVDWISYIPTLTWDAFVAAVNWQVFIGAISWDTFIAALGWSSFVPGVDWASFVPGITWGEFVPQINWGAFVESISWGDFVPSVNWANFIPFFGGGGGGGGAAGGGGSDLPRQLNPDDPRPQSFSSGIGNDIGVASMGGGGAMINIYANVASDIDVESLANRVARVISRKQR